MMVMTMLTTIIVMDGVKNYSNNPSPVNYAWALLEVSFFEVLRVTLLKFTNNISIFDSLSLSVIPF